MNACMFVFLVAMSGQAPDTVAINNDPGSAAGPKRSGIALELSAAPNIGKPIANDSDEVIVDDSEYEVSVRAWTLVDPLNDFRIQVKAGLTSTPHMLDGKNPESSAYGEVQLGNVYVPLRRLIRRDFKEAGKLDNAWQPYVRYRYASVHQGFLDAKSRTDQMGTVGLTYRRVPYRMEGTTDTRGLWFDLRGEVNRIWSTDSSEDLWNPKVQFSLYGRPTWRGARLVLKAALEANLFTTLNAPDGDRRRDLRLRLTPGVDISPVVESFIGTDAIEVELLVRFQRRWSNDPTAEHTRFFAVPTFTATVPFF